MTTASAALPAVALLHAKSDESDDGQRCLTAALVHLGVPICSQGAPAPDLTAHALGCQCRVQLVKALLSQTPLRNELLAPAHGKSKPTFTVLQPESGLPVPSGIRVLAARMLLKRVRAAARHTKTGLHVWCRAAVLGGMHIDVHWHHVKLQQHFAWLQVGLLGGQAAASARLTVAHAAQILGGAQSSAARHATSHIACSGEAHDGGLIVHSNNSDWWCIERLQFGMTATCRRISVTVRVAGEQLRRLGVRGSMEPIVFF